MNFKNRQNRINLVIFGCGYIASKLVESLVSQREHHRSILHNIYDIKSIFDSSGFIYNGDNMIASRFFRKSK